MILIDRRVGSADLLKPIQGTGLPATLSDLSFGDIAFAGKGTNDSTIMVGIEFKNLNDLVQSIRSGRLAGHQLPGLRKTYDYCWLLVEGLWQHDANGNIVTFAGKGRPLRPLRGGMRASELEKHLISFDLCGGLHIHATNTRKDSVRWIANLYHWWTDTALDQHTSHLALHDLPTLIAVSPFRQAICKFPGIGLKMSKAVEKHFGGSLRAAVNAPANEWAEITTVDVKGKTRRLGAKTADLIIRFCEAKR